MNRKLIELQKKIVNNKLPYFPKSIDYNNSNRTNEKISRKCACEMENKIEDDEKELKINRKYTGNGENTELSDIHSTAIHNILSESGKPLDKQTKDYMEPRFGYDFSNVRIYAESEAYSRSTDSINALAYTLGNSIVFGKGQYSPLTSEGKKLLAHELTHVKQQSDSDKGFYPSFENTNNDTADLYNGRYETNFIGTELNIVHRQQDTGSSGEVKTQPPPDTTIVDRLRSQLAMLKRMWNEKRYGCWCGPGNVCNEVRDDIDSCCKDHDNGYKSVGVTSGTPGPGEVDMWSSEGLVRTMPIDLALVDCTHSTWYDFHFYGPSAVLYRASVELIFGTRALIAANLIIHPWIRW